MDDQAKRTQIALAKTQDFINSLGESYKVLATVLSMLLIQLSMECDLTKEEFVAFINDTWEILNIEPPVTETGELPSNLN